MTDPAHDGRVVALPRTVPVTSSSAPAAEDAAVRLARLITGAPHALLVRAEGAILHVESGPASAGTELPLAGLPGAEAFTIPLTAHLVPDAPTDVRYRGHPLVTGPPHARSVAAVGLPGAAPRALLVLSREPHAFTRAHLEALDVLANEVAARREAEARAEALTARLDDALLMKVQEVARLGTWEWDFTTGQVTWSEQLYRIYGLTPEVYSPSYEGYLLRVHPDDREHVRQVTERGFASRKPYSHDERILRPDGTLRHLHTWTQPTLDAEGNLLRLNGVCQDITDRVEAEQAARRANAEIVRIYESMADAFFAVDHEWRFVYMNPMAHRMRASMTWEEQKGKRLWDIYPDLVGTKFWTEYHRAMETQTPARFEDHYPRMDRWFEVAAYPSPAGLSVYFRDVTARKRAELALAESEERWRSLVESTPARVILVESDGRIVFQNTRPGEPLPAVSIVGRSMFDFLAPTQAEAVRAHLARAFEGHSVTYEIEGYRTGSSTPRWYRSTLGPVYQDGRVKHVIALSEDVTERREAEQRFRDLSLLNEEILENVPAGVVYLDEAFTITRMNRYMRDVFGFPDGALPPDITVDPRTFPEVIEWPHLPAAFDRLANGTPFYNVEWSGRSRLNGADRVISLSGVPLFEAGPGTRRLKGAILLVRDVTQKKRSDAELEASRRQLAMSEKLSALGTLVAGVAHEINNPLSFMKGTAQIIQEALAEALAAPDLPQEVRDTLAEAIRNDEIVLQGIERIAHITKSLKLVARASTGAFAAEDVNALADSVLTVAHPRFSRGLKVTTDLRATRPARANGTEMSQVLLNLVLNAAEAIGTQPGGEIRVSTHDEGDDVILEVADNGPGIPPADHHRLFTPFFTTKAQGTGLGLSVSYRIVEDHGGKLTFTSAPGKGTTFRVAIPAVTPA